MSQALPWYVARSAGLLSWALLTASVVWGLALSGKAKVFGRKPRPNWTLDLHRFLGGLATIFVVVHVAAILADTYIGFGLTSVLVPFASSWRPGAVAWGVAGLYLLLAVELTSLARARLPRKAWRAVHFASFPLFLFATMHAFTAGTDTGSAVFVAVAVVAILVIAALTAVRVRQATRPAPVPPPSRPVRPRRPAAPLPPPAAGAVPSTSRAAAPAALAPVRGLGDPLVPAPVPAKAGAVAGAPALGGPRPSAGGGSGPWAAPAPTPDRPALAGTGPHAGSS